MTLEKAIEYLSEYVYEDKPCPIGLYDEATRLLIEAGKRLQAKRELGIHYDQTLLPGETKE